MTFAEISPEKQVTLLNFHTQYRAPSRITKITSVTGAFLMIISLIVAISASLCLAIPGINVISSIVLPGIAPGLAGFTCSIILITMGAYYRSKIKKVQDEWIGYLKRELVAAHTKKKKTRLLKNMLATEGDHKAEKEDRPMKKHLLSTLKSSYPKSKERSKDEEKAVDAIDKVLKIVNKQR